MPISTRLAVALILTFSAGLSAQAVGGPATDTRGKAASRPASDLRIRLKEGEVVRVVLDVTTTRINVLPKMGVQNQYSEWLQEIEFSQRNASENRTFLSAKFIHTRIRFAHPLFGGAIFDSRNPSPPESYHPVMLVAAGFYLGYVGQTLTFELDAEGRILQVEGAENMEKALALLADATPQTKQMKTLFETNAKLYFDGTQVKNFLQPILPQTSASFAEVGAIWPAKNGHYIFTGTKNSAPVEWDSLVTLQERSADVAVLGLGGEFKKFEPYQFGKLEKGTSRTPRVLRGNETRPTSAPAPSKRGRTLEKVAKGRGVVAKKDGLYNELDLELSWLDDKPEYKEADGPGESDERRHDVVVYKLRRVTEFPTAWPEIPSAPK